MQFQTTQTNPASQPAKPFSPQVVLCRPCTAFAGAGKPIYHDPPECPIGQPSYQRPSQQSPAIDLQNLIDLAMQLHDVSGIEVSIDSPDDLIDCFEVLDLLAKKAGQLSRDVRMALADLCEGDAATRRIRGERRAAKVSSGPVKFEQSILKEAYFAFPEFRDECLKVESVAVRQREFNKIKNATGPEAFEAFRDKVAGAELGRIGMPSVSIEK